jgi:hypothetical protein
VSETHTPQGEIKMGSMVHGAAMNCHVSYYGRPDDWHFVQFFSEEEIYDYARSNNLVVKRDQE